VRRDRRVCVAQLRLNDVRFRGLLPAPQRSRDEGCPSGASRGKAPLSAFGWMARGVGRREPADPCLVKPRLAHDGTVAIGPKGAKRRGCHGVARSRRLKWRTGPQPRPEVSPSPAQAGCASSTCAPGIGRSCGCARGLFWLQNSTSGVRSRCSIRGVPQARPRIRLGLAIELVARMVKGRRKPVLQWRHCGASARLSMIPCLSIKQGVSQAWRGPDASRSGGGSTRRTKASWFQRSRRF